MPGLKEEKHETDKKMSKAAMKGWLMGLTKKRKDEAAEEASTAGGPEPFVVRTMVYSE